MRGERVYDLHVRDKVFTGGTHVMAILNATPDSFYEDSRHRFDAVETARKFIEQGAEIIDVGGQSTRPGAVKVGSLEEMSRVLPVIEQIRAEFPDIPISVDTFYPDVASSAIDAGADMINDVSCLLDKNLAKVVAQNDVAICVMHDRRDSKIKEWFLDKEAGLANAVDKLLDMFEEYPFLLGTSRKSMFGGTPETRLSATLDSTMLAVKQGVLFVRVHDVKENRAVINLAK